MATMKELAGHFGVSIQTMTEYVKRHLDEINADGSHAALRAGKWAFDAEAVRKLEELRGFGIAGVMEAVESKKVKDLEVTVDNLQVALLHAQFCLFEAFLCYLARTAALYGVDVGHVFESLAVDER